MTEQIAETEQQIQTPDAGSGTSRDDLIAAVREAGGTGSVDVEAEERAAAERAAAGSPEPQAQTQAQAEEELRIANILKQREADFAAREKARNHAQEMIQRAEQEAARIREEALAQVRREAEAERERLRAEFRSSPTATLRALGDPQEISDAVMRDGTPEARAMRQLEQRLAGVEQKASIAETVKQQIDQFRAEQQAEAQRQLAEQTRAQFLQVASREATPYLNARYDADEIWLKGNEVAAHWRRGGMNLVPNGAPKGENDFDFEDVAKYLDSDARKRISAAGLTPAQQVSAGAPAKEPGNAPKVPANGTRTLTAAQGSERRTAPKPLHEMSPAEQRQALIEEVAAARRANPDAKV